jgi:(4S)-4-hydroxy-5-phosphonooxypentane-2,3-dione isomerase
LYGGMVKLVARAGRKQELLDFLRWDAEVATAQEPGTLRFDVWERDDEPDAVYLYEAYVDQAAFEAHKANAPFQRFVDEIVPNVVEPPTFVIPVTQSFVSNADG